MHDYGQDFYGSTLKVCILGHLRPELNFDSLQSLIDAINNDIAQAKTRLDEPEALKYKNHMFFKEIVGINENESITKINKNAANGQCPNSSPTSNMQGKGI